MLNRAGKNAEVSGENLGGGKYALLVIELFREVHGAVLVPEANRPAEEN